MRRDPDARVVVHSAAPDLATPGRFLRQAAADLRRSAPIASRLLRGRLRLRYRLSWLGYLWMLLPAASAALLALIATQARLFAVGPTPIAYPLFVLAGVICWQLFADAVLMPAGTLASAQRIAVQTGTPHEALLLSGLLEMLLTAILRVMVLLLPLCLIFDTTPDATVLLLPVGLVGLAALGLSLGLLLAPVGLLYDDVNRLLTILLGAWFFLTPVIYPPRGGALFWLNPVAPLLDGSRAALTGGTVSAALLAWAVASTIGAVFAWLAYRVARPHLTARLG